MTDDDFVGVADGLFQTLDADEMTVPIAKPVQVLSSGALRAELVAVQKKPVVQEPFHRDAAVFFNWVFWVVGWVMLIGNGTVLTVFDWEKSREEVRGAQITCAASILVLLGCLILSAVLRIEQQVNCGSSDKV